MTPAKKILSATLKNNQNQIKLWHAEDVEDQAADAGQSGCIAVELNFNPLTNSSYVKEKR